MVRSSYRAWQEKEKLLGVISDEPLGLLQDNSETSERELNGNEMELGFAQLQQFGAGRWTAIANKSSKGTISMFSKIWKKLSGRPGEEVQEQTDLGLPNYKTQEQIDQLNSYVVSLDQMGQYDEAIEYATLSVALTRQTVGEQHPVFAASLNNLARLYREMGNYAAAEPLLLQALGIRRVALGEDHPDFAASLNNLALLYDLIGNYAAAESFYRQALEIARTTLGEQHQDLALCLNNLAMLYHSTGRYAAAEPLFLQAIEIMRITLGDAHPDFATNLNNLALLYHSMGNYVEAERLLLQALEIRRTMLGDAHPDFASSLNNLGTLYHSKGNYAAAEPLLLHALEIMHKTLGEAHPDFAQGLNNLALLYYSMGNYAAAKQLLRQVLEIRRTALGEVHPDFAISLNSVGGLYREMGDYWAAEPLLRQALVITRTKLGESHPNFATTLSNLAGLYNSMGDYVAAEPLFLQAIEIRRTTLGEAHPDFAASLNNLAELYYLIGDYAEAERFYRQASEIYRIALGEVHPDFASSLSNLAWLYREMGNYAAAEPLFLQAIAIRSIALGEAHPDFAGSLNNLGLLYDSMGNDDAAEPFLRQALKIRRTALGETHPDFAGSLNNLGLLYDSMGNYAAAEPLLRQALENMRTVLGEAHPNFATGLNSLGLLYYSMGDYAAAEPLYQQAIEICRAALGEQHPSFATNLNSLASLFAATGRQADAKKMMEDALAIDYRMIRQVFSISSEEQRTAYLRSIRGNLELFLSLVNQDLSNSPEAMRSALSLVLRRKTIEEAEALSKQRDALLGLKYPEAAPKLKEIRTLRAQIAQKTLAGPGKEGLRVHQQLLAGWNTRKERLEADAPRHVSEMNLEERLRSIDHQVVAMAMPAGATLVEFVRFDVFDFKAVPARGERRWKPAHYLVFVMPAAEPDAVEMIDLGEAEPIDRMTATFRSSITGQAEGRRNLTLGRLPSSAGETNGKDIGVELRDASFTPVLKAVGNRKRLLISPDGDLTRLPFEVLPTDDGQRLIDEYRISYLGAGRDVVRFEFISNREPSRSLVAADPDFDFGAMAMPADVAAGAGRRSLDLKRRTMKPFNRLPGTRREGENIAAMLDAELWTGGAALDARLKRCQSPRILHLATHGFFFEDQNRDPNEDRFRVSAVRFSEGGIERLMGAHLENPLLRSGLAFAGVNTWLETGELMEEAEDGLLTAEDVSGLDLLDTELVVLSACDTGLGEVRVGEGVFGLRRAFVLAGAKTLVMSLWKVPDEQTRELMEDFYGRIMSGEPRADALREAQLTMKQKYPQPFYWGAFICQGDPSPLPPL